MISKWNALFMLVAVLFFSGAWAGRLEEGMAAYERRDYDTALKTLGRLASEGDAVAQFFLGGMYSDGQGVPQDYVLAHMWFNIAAANGDVNYRVLASKDRDMLADTMTRKQIAQAQDMARDCLAKNYKGCY